MPKVETKGDGLLVKVAGQLGPWTIRPVDSSARSGQLGPYVPDNSARRFILNACLESKLIKY